MPTSTVVSSGHMSSDQTLTLTHNFVDHKTTMTFTKESEVFSVSVENDSSIIRQALEETLIHV